MLNFRRRWFACKYKGHIMENTISPTKEAVKDYVISLHSRRDMHDRTIKPTWKELSETGFELAKIQLEEIK